MKRWSAELAPERKEALTPRWHGPLAGGRDHGRENPPIKWGDGGVGGRSDLGAAVLPALRAALQALPVP